MLHYCNRGETQELCLVRLEDELAHASDLWGISKEGMKAYLLCSDPGGSLTCTEKAEMDTQISEIVRLFS